MWHADSPWRGRQGLRRKRRKRKSVEGSFLSRLVPCHDKANDRAMMKG
jgi:hypothetical protein